MEKISVRAVIPYNDGFIVIHRIRTDREYYVFPGGKIEEGESVDECVEREVMEEIGIKSIFKKVLYEVIWKDKKQYYAYVEYVKGKIGTGEGPEFTSEEYKNSGKYIPEVKTLDELSGLNLLPQLAEVIKNDINVYSKLENIPFRKL